MLHRLEVVGGGKVGERPLAHHVGPQRRVSGVDGDVDAQRLALEHVEVGPEGRPPERHPRRQRRGRDVLGPFEVVDHELVGPGRDGASVNPQLPITAVVTPCQHDDVPSGSQNIWASMCVCPSMKPGVTTWPLASSLAATPLGQPADRDDPAAAARHIGAEGGHAGAVDHRAVAGARGRRRSSAARLSST